MNKADIELALKVANVLFDWSGAAGDTPDDTEVISTASGLESITVGELKDLLFFLDNLKTEMSISKDGLIKIKP